MNYLHLMKKVAIAILCVLSVANAQDKRFAFKGNAAQAGSSGISTATARQNTGWTASGTLARDTLYTNYAIFGAKTFGVGGTTQAQNARAKFNVLGRAANDTLAIWSNDGSGIVGDSTVVIDAGGRMGIKTFPSANYGLRVSGGSAANITAASYEVGMGGTGTLLNTSSGSSIAMLGGGSYGGGMRFNAAANGNRTDRSFWFQTASDTLAAFGLGAANKGYYSFGNGIKPQSQNQAIFTIRPAVPVNDTLFMARNDKNATLDSTFMVFANGSAYVGGNNLYFGANRIRSVTGDTAFVFYAGSTQAFAILADGTTADLVATTPFWKFFDKFRNEVLFWILAVAGILACILALLSIYAKVRTIRFGGYETLAENS